MTGHEAVTLNTHTGNPTLLAPTPITLPVDPDFPWIAVWSGELRTLMDLLDAISPPDEPETFVPVWSDTLRCVQARCVVCGGIEPVFEMGYVPDGPICVICDLAGA